MRVTSYFRLCPFNITIFTSIDVGAGKGRVLLIASTFPFKRLIGVEFARELVDVAQRNIERSGCRAEIVCAGASEYSFPLDDIVVYLYNPLGLEILRGVLASLQKISERREVYLIYLNSQTHWFVKEFARELYHRAGAKVYHFGQHGR
jgi:predicted RNA methylase